MASPYVFRSQGKCYFSSGKYAYFYLKDGSKLINGIWREKSDFDHIITALYGIAANFSIQAERSNIAGVVAELRERTSAPFGECVRFPRDEVYVQLNTSEVNTILDRISGAGNYKDKTDERDAALGSVSTNNAIMKTAPNDKDNKKWDLDNAKQAFTKAVTALANYGEGKHAFSRQEFEKKKNLVWCCEGCCPPGKCTFDCEDNVKTCCVTLPKKPQKPGKPEPDEPDDSEPEEPEPPKQPRKNYCDYTKGRQIGGVDKKKWPDFVHENVKPDTKTAQFVWNMGRQPYRRGYSTDPSLYHVSGSQFTECPSNEDETLEYLCKKLKEDPDFDPFVDLSKVYFSYQEGSDFVGIFIYYFDTCKKIFITQKDCTRSVSVDILNAQSALLGKASSYDNWYYIGEEFDDEHISLSSFKPVKIFKPGFYAASHDDERFSKKEGSLIKDKYHIFFLSQEDKNEYVKFIYI